MAGSGKAERGFRGNSSTASKEEVQVTLSTNRRRAARRMGWTAGRAASQGAWPLSGGANARGGCLPCAGPAAVRSQAGARMPTGSGVGVQIQAADAVDAPQQKDVFQ